jgi:hypothetical protein
MFPYTRDFPNPKTGTKLAEGYLHCSQKKIIRVNILLRRLLSIHFSPCLPCNFQGAPKHLVLFNYQGEGYVHGRIDQCEVLFEPVLAYYRYRLSMNNEWHRRLIIQRRLIIIKHIEVLAVSTVSGTLRLVRKLIIPWIYFGREKSTDS